MRLRLIAFVVLSVMIAWAPLETNRANAATKNWSSGTITLWATYWEFGIPIFAPFYWTNTAGATYTPYAGYNLLTFYGHNTQTTTSYGAYNLVATNRSRLYNGVQSLRYTFDNNFGFGCFYDPSYEVKMCGSQPTEIWFNPSPGYSRFDGYMVVSMAGWSNYGGTEFHSNWNWYWP